MFKMGKIVSIVYVYLTFLLNTCFAKLSLHKAWRNAICTSLVGFSALQSQVNEVGALENYVAQSFSIGPSETESVKIYQGFAALKGKAPAKGGGDRTGAYAWHGGVELGKTLADKKIVDVKSKRVLDLGTGTGVVGISAVIEGAKEVALTDGAEDVIEVARYNVQNNFPTFDFTETKIDNMSPPALYGVGKLPTISSSSTSSTSSSGNQVNTYIAVGRLKWMNQDDIHHWLQWHPSETSTTTTTRPKKEEKYDIVLASEVFYQRQSIDKLLYTIKEVVKPASEGGKVVFRLTPDLTDETRGFNLYLLPRMKELGYDILLAPSELNNETEDDVSQVIVSSIN